MAGKNKQKIDTAVIAAAGFGTRLLPLTLHQPKAMVPVADRPLIHYIVDQIAAGGIKRFIIVLNPDLQAVRKYIDYHGGVWVTAVAKDLWRVRDIIEKPSAKEAPSNLGSMADYILPPDIFHYIRLAQKTLPKNKEVAVAHALKIYLQKRGNLLGWVFRGRHFDGGSKIGLAKASVYFGVKHPELGASFKKYLKL